MAPTERSQRTRGAILTAARGRFASHGYRSTTIRAIAGDAGIDPALVMRYYGTKAELFAAAVDVDLQLPDLREVPDSEHGQRLAEHFLLRWDPRTVEGEVLVTLLRAAAADPDRAEELRRIFVAQLVTSVRGIVDDDVEAAHRAGLVASQMLGLALTRFILELPPVAAMSVDRAVAILGPTIQRYLHDPATQA